MPPNSTPYGWLDGADYADAGCLTLVTGTSSAQVLEAVGAEITSRDRQLGGTDDAGSAQISVVEDVGGMPSGALVLVEANGWECSRPEVLQRLSRKGAAASVYWNVNGLVVFGCARSGKVRASAEIREDDGGAANLPASLRSVWRRSIALLGPVGAGLAMAEEFTGVTIPASTAISHPVTAHRITAPVLTLRVTPEELVTLQYPSPEVLEAARAASPHRLRAVAEWAVIDALREADIFDAPELATTTSRIGTGQPLILHPTVASYRHEADRRLRAADPNKVEEGDLEGEARQLAERQFWGPRYWAVEALAYLAAKDDLTALLGSTYCAGIRHRLGSDAHGAYLDDVVSRLQPGT